MTKLLLGCLTLAGMLGLPFLNPAQPPVPQSINRNTTVVDDTDNAPTEQGAVQWLRNYDAAIAKSKSTGKPLFVLFQEVPG